MPKYSRKSTASSRLRKPKKARLDKIAGTLSSRPVPPISTAVPGFGKFSTHTQDSKHSHSQSSPPDDRKAIAGEFLKLLPTDKKGAAVADQKGNREQKLLEEMHLRLTAGAKPSTPSTDTFEKDIAQAIFTVQMLADEKKGIHSEIKEVSHDSKKHLVWYRDARGQGTEDYPDDNETPYWAMGLNYIRATKVVLQVMLRKNFSQADIRSFYQLTGAFLTDIAANPSYAEETWATLVNETLIPLIRDHIVADSDLSKKQAGKKAKDLLKTAMKHGGLAQPTLIPATHIKVGQGADSKDVLLIDVPLTNLSDTQQKEYELISKYDVESKEVKEIKWFVAYPVEKRRMIQYSARAILAGHPTPAPMAEEDQLTGLRNGGQEFYFFTGSTGDEQPELFFTQYHSGHPSAKIKRKKQKDPKEAKEDKENAEQITKENIKQFVAATRDPHNRQQDYVLTDLTSRSISSEAKLHDMLTSVCSGKGIAINSLAAHPRGRLVSPNRYDGINVILHRAKEILERKATARNAPDSNQREQLESLTLEVINIQQSIQFTNHDIENLNIRLVSRSSELANLINNIEGYERIVMLPFCFSGKDRTNVMHQETTTDVLDSAITGQHGDGDSQQRQEISAAISRSEHYRVKPGLNSIGCTGGLETLSNPAAMFSTVPNRDAAAGRRFVSEQSAYNKSLPRNPRSFFSWMINSRSLKRFAMTYLAPLGAWLASASGISDLIIGIKSRRPVAIFKGLGRMATWVGLALCFTGVGAAVGLPLLLLGNAVASIADSVAAENGRYSRGRRWVTHAFTALSILCASTVILAPTVPAIQAAGQWLSNWGSQAAEGTRFLSNAGATGAIVSTASTTTLWAPVTAFFTAAIAFFTGRSILNRRQRVKASSGKYREALAEYENQNNESVANAEQKSTANLPRTSSQSKIILLTAASNSLVPAKPPVSTSSPSCSTAAIPAESTFSSSRSAGTTKYPFDSDPLLLVDTSVVVSTSRIESFSAQLSPLKVPPSESEFSDPESSTKKDSPSSDESKGSGKNTPVEPDSPSTSTTTVTENSNKQTVNIFSLLKSSSGNTLTSSTETSSFSKSAEPFAKEDDAVGRRSGPSSTSVVS